MQIEIITMFGVFNRIVKYSHYRSKPGERPMTRKFY